MAVEAKDTVDEKDSIKEDDLEMEGRLVYLVNINPELSRDMMDQITYNGYRALAFDNMEQVIEAASYVYPSTIIAEIAVDDDDVMMSVAAIQNINEQVLPIIYISDAHELNVRLRAVRFGGSSFLPKPVDYNRLIGLLNDSMEQKIVDPYRVLLVQRDKELAQGYKEVLEESGMVTASLEEPLEVLDAIHSFNPELILMNLIYPDCLGMELAAVIRQQDALQGISIVFLSNETRLDPQMAALRTGGDAFLPHGVSKEYLISAIGVRVERSRVLRSLMYKDSLTGLLNHTTARATLSTWAARAKATDSVFSVAFLDIDKFKRVNDTHGHPAGDRVIQSLARLVQRRLRTGDVAGRFGGEEFMLLFADLDADQAISSLHRIRKDFGRIRQRSEVGEFYVTFSSGLICSRDFTEPEEMNDAADRALYAAKAAGGNRVGRIKPKE